jgi:hypothetical protein
MVGILSFVSFTLVDQNIFASLEQRLILGRVAFKKMLLQDTLYNSDLVINLDIHTITFLLFLIGISIFLLFLKPWARSFVLCFIFLGLIVFSQVIFFMFDINIYVIKLILSSILVFFFTTLLDVDLDYVNWFQAFNKLPKKMMWGTFNVILKYLWDNNKIGIDKNDYVVYIWNPELARRFINKKGY